jgi:hypothetical protein
LTRDDGTQRRFDFPPWFNHLRIVAAVAAVMVPVYAVLLFYGGFSPRTTAVGYRPIQPVPYSHALHAGQLGIDCRYCHTTVETAAFAAIPPTQTCMNCHHAIRKDSPALLPVRESYATGEPVRWVKVHDLPEFAYFDHSAHVRHGVGCVSCHGRIDKMDVVQQAEPLNMLWCLDCHRHPERKLRPLDQVTVMDYVPREDQAVLGPRLVRDLDVRTSTDCSTCHR